LSAFIDWLLYPNKGKVKKGKKSKLKKGKFRDEEEEVEEIKFVDEPEAPAPKPEKLQMPTVEDKMDRIQVPRGKAFINVDKRSWLHIIVGLALVIVNFILFGIGTVGWASRWEEKVLISAYALPSIYVTLSYTWWKIQGQRIDIVE